MRRLLLLVAVLATLSPTGLARAQTFEDFQGWAALFGTARLQREGPSPLLWLDTHVRRGDVGTVHILRPGVGVAPLPWLQLYAGYAWVPVFDDAADTVAHEHRIWQQAILTHRTDFGLSMQSRSRLEQRFSDQHDQIGLRFREFVRFEWQPWAEQPVGFVVWDELFLGVDTGPNWQEGFDQNRLYGALAVHTLENRLRVEAGYVFVVVRRPQTARPERVSHVLAVNLFVSLSPPPPPAEESPATEAAGAPR